MQAARQPRGTAIFIEPPVGSRTSPEQLDGYKQLAQANSFSVESRPCPDSEQGIDQLVSSLVQRLDATPDPVTHIWVPSDSGNGQYLMGQLHDCPHQDHDGNYVVFWLTEKVREDLFA